MSKAMHLCATEPTNSLTESKRTITYVGQYLVVSQRLSGSTILAGKDNSQYCTLREWRGCPETMLNGDAFGNLGPALLQ
jgi:hypothetical protein